MVGLVCVECMFLFVEVVLSQPYSFILSLDRAFTKFLPAGRIIRANRRYDRKEW